MHWNHRVIRKPQDDEDAPYTFEIHEVFYDDDGYPDGYTENAVAPFGESISELKQDLEWFMRALDKPVLEDVDGKLEQVVMQTTAHPGAE